MAIDSFGGKPFGLRELKVRAYTGGTSTPLPYSMKLKFTERVQSAELKGDDVIASVVSLVEGAEFEIEGGGIDLAAYAIMTGRTTTLSSTTPNRTLELTGKGGEGFPYFVIFGRSLAEAGDDLHCRLFKCKLTAGLSGTLENGRFLTTGIKGICLPVSSGAGIFEFVENETAAAVVL